MTSVYFILPSDPDSVPGQAVCTQTEPQTTNLETLSLAPPPDLPRQPVAPPEQGYPTATDGMMQAYEARLGFSGYRITITTAVKKKF